MNELALDQLEAEIVARLEADTWFAQSRQKEDLSYVTIPVIAEEKGDLKYSVLSAIDSIGISVVVRATDALIDDRDSSGPVFNPIAVTIVIVENVMVNRGTTDAPSSTGTLKTAKSTALRIAGLLHHWKPDSMPVPLMMSSQGVSLIVEENGVVQYNVRLACCGGLDVELDQVADPSVSEDAGSVTLSTATAGAAIFYTTDGRKPSPTAGTLYTAPFSPGTGVTVKARAWLAGYLPSNQVSHLTTT